MPVRRFIARLSNKPGVIAYGLALGLAGAALALRASLPAEARGFGYSIILLPTIVVSGAFFGTGPAALSAAAGGVAFAILFMGRPLLAWPPFNAAQVDSLLFILACAATLFATSTLRRLAVRAASAEARLAEVFRQIPGVAAILEAPEGRLLLRSAHSAVVLGLAEPKVQRSSDLGAYGALHPDGRPFAADEYPIVRALKSGEIIHGEQFQYRQPSGRIVMLDVHAGPVRDAQGRIVGSVGTAFDITERVETERRLRESEAEHRALSQRLAAAVDAGALGLWEVDLRAQRIRIDAVLAAMIGLPPSPIEMNLPEVETFIDPADRQRGMAAFAGASETGHDYADEIRMLTPQNTTRWFVVRSAMLAEAHKIIGVARDVTGRRRREDALRDALQAREMLMREADHRIKNSLQLVTSLLRLQQGRVADPDARQALGAAIARVTAIADAHLALQGSPDLRSLEVDQMLEDLCERMGALNPAVVVRCRAESRSSLDARQAIPLGLIASEILTNALRHAYKPDTPGEVALSAQSSEGGIELVIADDGVGLPALPGRAGLGTSVIAALARQIGAEVIRKSEPGRGATVIVRLNPVQDTQGAVADEAAAAP
jgi:two-component sensor histidine kinase/PAS domain-containing protein